MIHSILLIGQSNMSGRGNLDDLTDISNENVFVLRENGIITGIAVLAIFPVSENNFGLYRQNC